MLVMLNYKLCFWATPPTLAYSRPTRKPWVVLENKSLWVEIVGGFWLLALVGVPENPIHPYDLTASGSRPNFTLFSKKLCSLVSVLCFKC